MLYPFFAGLLLHRVANPMRGAFLVCSLLLLAVLAMPRIGGSQQLWANGLYDALSIILLFHFIVLLGAGEVVRGQRSTRFCRFLGDLPYPIYITHYPLIYTYTAWVQNTKPFLREALPVGALVFLASIFLAYASLKWYDEPLRRWLQRKRGPAVRPQPTSA